MDGLTRGRARTRGPRRGRGVRVQLPVPVPVPALVEGEVVVSRRGGTRGGRGGARGGRRGRRGSQGPGPNRRPGPSTIDELIIHDISEMPIGDGLETPLHTKRMRLWQPSRTALIPAPTASPILSFQERTTVSATAPPQSPVSAMPPSPPTFVECDQPAPSTPTGSLMMVRLESQSPVLAMPPSPAMFVECGESSPAPSTSSGSLMISQSPTLAMLPSPAMFVECGQSSPAPSTSYGSLMMSHSPALAMPPSPAMSVECGQSSPVPSTSSGSPMGRPLPRPRQILNEEDIFFALNFGSDGSSDESDEEETSSLIPRVFRSMMETPLDDDVAEPVPTGHTPAAASTSAAVVHVASAETHQPTSFYEFDWNTFPNPPLLPGSRRETFSESNGPTIPHVDPYNIFIAIWDRQIMEYIASESNRYVRQMVQQLIANNSLQPKSRIRQWHDSTADELYIYFGIIIAMGVVVKSRLEEYWNTTVDIFTTPGFGAHIAHSQEGCHN